MRPQMYAEIAGRKNNQLLRFRLNARIALVTKRMAARRCHTHIYPPTRLQQLRSIHFLFIFWFLVTAQQVGG